MTAQIVVRSERLRDPFETPMASEGPQGAAQTPGPCSWTGAAPQGLPGAFGAVSEAMEANTEPANPRDSFTIFAKGGTK